MSVSNEDCATARIHGCGAAPTPTGFAEIVSDYFPVPQTTERGRIGNQIDAAFIAATADFIKGHGMPSKNVQSHHWVNSPSIGHYFSLRKVPVISRSCALSDFGWVAVTAQP